VVHRYPDPLDIDPLNADTVESRRRIPFRLTIATLCAVTVAIVAAGIVFVARPGSRPHATAEPIAADDRSSERAARGADRGTPDASATPSASATSGTAPGASPQPTAAPPRPVRTPLTQAPQPTRSATRTAAPPPAQAPAGCASYTGNRRTACSLLPSFGFATGQMPALDNLWERESGWNHLASNPSSGAYGIPQALPGSKMGSVASDWRTNPATQIKWGLGYIKDRYGSPAAAWAFFQANNWY
jgi:hypothetical protein